jgi:hypothetical protein
LLKTVYSFVDVFFNSTAIGWKVSKD